MVPWSWAYAVAYWAMSHEAEDALQATFLILARKATSVIRREKVASWLYGVACRTAEEARGRASAQGPRRSA